MEYFREEKAFGSTTGEAIVDDQFATENSSVKRCADYMKFGCQVKLCAVDATNIKSQIIETLKRSSEIISIILIDLTLSDSVSCNLPGPMMSA